MLVTRELILPLFKKIEEFRSAVQEAGGDPRNTPISVENMRLVAEKKLGVKIDSEEVTFEAIHTHSCVIRGTDRHLILIRKDLDTLAVKRAAFTKELCHLLFDPEYCWSTYVEKTITDVIEHRHLEIDRGDQRVEVRHQHNGACPPQNTIFVEEVAEWSMTELLYPRERRSEDRQALLDCALSYRRISDTRQIPLWMARTPYTKWYQELEKLRCT